MSRSVRVLLLFLLLPVSAFAQELPAWNDGKSKQAILDFVKKVTTERGADYVAPEDRIAVFDNDGTLWTEQPFYFQLGFILDRVKALAPEHPEWKEKEPFKSILAGDLKGIAKSGERGIVELAMETHSGMTTEDFRKIVINWFSTARHPKTGKPYNEMTFLPMHDLLDYLRANGFKTFIVSGGGEFMREITDKAYGIPPEQVVGSTITTQYALVDETPVLNRLPKIDFVDDGPGKPVGINKFIGRRPVFAAGNSDGDYEMLRWVMAGQGPHFAMIIHHTDADREYAYDRKSDFGRLDNALDEAAARNWLLVDMKADWKKIYAFDQ
ncbi:haloacid dehalogenase-like hydrolase [Rhizobium tibeticum]|uniref:phosphoserine phosphatase n=1 Tax=Rhizobium tibeticum TaxID=501024 RepID=A0A1H8T2P1_9HYPH|nr:HAD family hydrolase [Rhizobium tibeticum]SEI14452.1 haloacid dehalogenase-like hydrolase [Rhizobium tibeticum]SEO84976.1 haloacid dehalogenase-like hydrolase [Rhizobium tibeticum]